MGTNARGEFVGVPVLPPVTGAPGYPGVAGPAPKPKRAAEPSRRLMALADSAAGELLRSREPSRPPVPDPEPVAVEPVAEAVPAEPESPRVPAPEVDEPAPVSIAPVPGVSADAVAAEILGKTPSAPAGRPVAVSADAVAADILKRRPVSAARPSTRPSPAPLVGVPAGPVTKPEQTGLYNPALHGVRPKHEKSGGGAAGPYVREVEGQLEELFQIGAGEIDPLTLKLRGPRPTTGEKAAKFGAELAMPRMVESDRQAALAVQKLQSVGAIPKIHYSSEPTQRKQQEARVRELARHLEGFDAFLDRRAANALEKIPYNPPADGVADGVTSAPEGPNDPRYIARDKHMAEYRSGYLKQAAGIYDAGRQFWDWPHVGAYLKSKGVTLGAFDRKILDAVIPAKRAEWTFRLGKHQAFAGDGLQGLAELPAGELQSVITAPLVNLVTRKGKALASPLVRAGVEKLEELTQGGSGRALRELSYLTQTSKTYMGKLGPAGKRIGDDLERLSMLADREAGASGKAPRELLPDQARALWGDDLEKLEPLLDQIAKEKSPAEARRVARFIASDVMGDASAAANAPGGAIFRGLSKYQTLTKLGLRPFTALRNATQRLTNSGLEHGVGPVLKAQSELLQPWKQATRLMKGAMQDAGVFAGENAGREGLGNKAADAALAMFDRAEKGNRYVAARVRQIGMEKDLNLLMKLESENPAVTRLRQVLTLGDRTEDAAFRRLARAGLDEDAVKDAIAKGGRLEMDQYQEAMHRAVTDQQFAQNLASSPMWWQSSPAMRSLTQFKGFGAKQTNLVWEYVGKEALVHKNYAPLARYLAFTQLAGELYHASRDVATGGRTSVSTYVAGQKAKDVKPEAKQVAVRMWQNFGAGGGLGLLTDFVMSPGGDAEWDRVAGAVAARSPGAAGKLGKAVDTTVGQQGTNFAAGPLGGTVRNVRDAAAQIQRDPKKAGKAGQKLLESEVPAVKDWRLMGTRGRRMILPPPKKSGPLQELQEQQERVKPGR